MPAASGRNFLHNNRHPHRIGVHDPDQGIRNISMPDEGGSVHGSARVYRVGNGSLDCLYPLLGSADGNCRWLRDNVPDLITRSEVADHSGMNRNLAGKARVKCEVELAGNDLYDLELFRLTDLIRPKVKAALPYPRAPEFDFGVNICGPQSPYHALRTAHPDLGPRNTFGIDLQVFRNVMKSNRSTYRPLRHRIAHHPQPQGHGKRQ